MQALYSPKMYPTEIQGKVSRMPQLAIKIANG